MWRICFISLLYDVGKHLLHDSAIKNVCYLKENVRITPSKIADVMGTHVKNMFLTAALHFFMCRWIFLSCGTGTKRLVIWKI